MIAERTIESQTGVENCAVFGLDQHIPDYYDVIHFNIPRGDSKESDKYLFLKQRDDPHEQATFDELMEEVYNQTGGSLLAGPYAISAIRVMLPNKNSTNYRFKIITPKDHDNFQSRVAIAQLLVDHGLVQC